MSTVEFDMSEFKDFFQAMDKAAKGEFRKELEEYIEAVGFDFLKVVQDEIIRRKVMDSRLLLASFEKGDDGNVWELTDGGLTLEVGTNVEYASYVNDGHWKNATGVERRWVPGHWEGDRFIYDPAEKNSGMLLTQGWVKGKPYWDSALRIINKIYPEILDAKLQEWIDNYFGG